jgi:alpha-L-arabinofuranosidase
MAATSRTGAIDVVVINASPVASVRSEVVIDGLLHKSRVRAWVLDGPSPTAYNTPGQPDNVTTVARSADVGNGDFSWRFPAHSVTMLQLLRQPPEFLAAGDGPISARVSSAAVTSGQISS